MTTTDHPESADSRLDEASRVVRGLIDMMRSNGLTKLDLEVADIRIRLRSKAGQESKIVQTRQQDPVIAMVSGETTREHGHVVTAPMIGTYYTSAAPNEPPFVREGDRVEAGQTIGIIEAMKIMNEIASDRAGVVLEVLASNAQPVEYGSPLLRLRLDEVEG